MLSKEETSLGRGARGEQEGEGTQGTALPRGSQSRVLW